MHNYYDSPTLGHLGAYRMIGSLLSQYYWWGLYANCKDNCKKCLTYQASMVSLQASVGQLYPLPTPTYNFDYMSTDPITHLHTIDVGFDSVYTDVDRLFKYIQFMSCTSSISADDLAQLFLANLICRHGMPKCIISDHDQSFTLWFWRQLVSSLGYQ